MSVNRWGNAADYGADIAPAIKPVVIQGMTELMTEMMGDDFAALGLAMDPADEKMFVATVPDKVQGASVIAYQNFMDQVAIVPNQ